MKYLPRPMIFMGFAGPHKKRKKNLSKTMYFMGLDRYGCVYGL
jgi:hypothetical protein